MTLGKNKSTPENREFWNHVEKVATDVRKREAQPAPEGCGHKHPILNQECPKCAGDYSIENPAPDAEREWLKANDYDMLLGSHLGVSGGALCLILKQYAADVREQCAKVADRLAAEYAEKAEKCRVARDQSWEWMNLDGKQVCEEVAAAIREGK